MADSDLKIPGESTAPPALNQSSVEQSSSPIGESLPPSADALDKEGPASIVRQKALDHPDSPLLDPRRQSKMPSAGVRLSGLAPQTAKKPVKVTVSSGRMVAVVRSR